MSVDIVLLVFSFLSGFLFHALFLHVISLQSRTDNDSWRITRYDDKTVVLPMSTSDIHTIIGMVVYVQRQIRKHPILRMWELPPARRTAEYISICSRLQDRIALIERADEIDL
jgi:hypothetical protein